MFDDYLTLLRKYSEKTQKEAASDANMNLSCYQSYENGSKVPDKECCLLLSKMLGFRDDIFCEGEKSIYNLHYLFETYDEDRYLVDADFEKSLYEQDFITKEELFLLSSFRKLNSDNKAMILEFIKNLSKDKEL